MLRNQPYKVNLYSSVFHSILKLKQNQLFFYLIFFIIFNNYLYSSAEKKMCSVILYSDHRILSPYFEFQMKKKFFPYYIGDPIPMEFFTCGAIIAFTHPNQIQYKPIKYVFIKNSILLIWTKYEENRRKNPSINTVSYNVSIKQSIYLSICFYFDLSIQSIKPWQSV